MADSDTEHDCHGMPPDRTHISLRIASIFILLAASLLGALIPVLLGRNAGKWHNLFFIFKFVGSGVILATAWMHLLAPAVEELGDPCLEDRLGDYDWAFFIGLATVLVMFFAEILATHYGDKAAANAGGKGRPGVNGNNMVVGPAGYRDNCCDEGRGDGAGHGGNTALHGRQTANNNHGGEDADGSYDHYPPIAFDALDDNGQQQSRDADTENTLKRGDNSFVDSDDRPNLAGQLTAVLILEFGVIFHSVFIGLVLATTKNLIVLLIVLVFHQFMEGLGLGSRLATAPWPGRRRAWIPYFLAFAFGVSTPLGIAAGLGARPTSAASQNLINGIFDSISAGILMYTGLVELLAHEFLLDPVMRSSGLGRQMAAYFSVLFGAGVMALLAKWA